MNLATRIGLLSGLAAGAAFGLVTVASQIAALLSPGLEVDFNQDYLLAEAIRHGIDPNMGLHQLAVALGMPGLIQADYPTPHPPTAGLLLLPLAWLPQTIAAVVWLLVSFGALTWAIALLSRLAGIRLPAWLILPVSLAALFWEPLSQDVGWGQMNAIMLALLAGVLVALSTNRRTLAGVLLAVSLLLKPVAWPLLLLLLVRRDWRAAGSCLLVGGVVGVITAIAVGPLRLVDYFIHSLPVATAYFRLDAFNISLASLGTRLLVGAEYPPGAPTLHFAPLFYSPLAATVLGACITVAVLAAGLIVAKRLPLQAALSCMVIVSLLITPTAWDHYLVLTLLPVALLIAALRRHAWPSQVTRCSVVLLALMALPAPLWEQRLNMAPFQATDSYWPVASSALALMPAYLLVALAVLGIIIERERGLIPAVITRPQSRLGPDAGASLQLA